MSLKQITEQKEQKNSILMYRYAKHINTQTMHTMGIHALLQIKCNFEMALPQ